MKKLYTLVCALFVSQLIGLTAVAAPIRKSARNDASKPLKIVFDNDVHGAINRYEYLAGYRNTLLKEGYPVLTVSIGDCLQGSAYATVSEGQFCLDMMKAVGYDVVAVGNHDLDYGLNHLLDLYHSQDSIQVVCANLLDAQGKNCFPSYVVRNCGGYRVAFIGVLTTATEQLEAYAAFDEKGNPVCTFAKDSLVSKVQRTIDIVQLAQPDWVVLLTHMGIDELEGHLTSVQLLEQLHGVDVVIDGHSHSIVNASVVIPNQEQRVVVVQTGAGMMNVGCLTLARGEKPSAKLFACQDLPQDAQVHKQFQQVEEQMRPVLSHVIGATPFELCYMMDGTRAVRSRETNLGDLVADAYRTILKTDIGWVNGGGLRTGIEAGDITYGNILSVSPFNNFMCVVQVTGEQLADALEEVYHKCPEELGSFAQISGVRCVIDTTCHPQLEWNEKNELTVIGARRVSNIEVLHHGEWKAVEKKAHYTIASTDYVVYEGESRGLRRAHIVKDKLITDTECLQNFVMSALEGNIPNEYAAPQNRIQFK